MADENTPQVGVRLQSRRQTHFVADDRVVHPILAAEVADGTAAGVNANPQLERLFYADISRTY
jgi:hypothetical protein